MKNKRPFGLFDEHIRLDKISKQGDPLEKLKKIIKWEIFRKIIEDVIIKESKGPGGRPRYDAILMFKILILQRYYNISDEQIEYQVLDRLSFMRFLDLNIKDDVPDHNTIWNFREDLTKGNIIDKLFEKFNYELEKNNLIAHKGSIVDASFVEVPRQRNSKDENEKINNNEIPKDWKKNPDKLSHKDMNARWITKNKEKHYGYKNHIKIDIKSKIIKRYTVTDAAVHDSQVIEKLLDRKDRNKKLFADSAYSGEPVKIKILKRKIISKIHEKGYRGRPLSEKQKVRNRLKSKIRARIEHVFGFIENSMNGSFLRVIGIERIKAQVGLMNLTYNMFRYMQLANI